jgi:hypothetical protein
MLTVFKFYNYGCVLANVSLSEFLIVLAYFVVDTAYLVVCGFCRTIRVVSVLF